MHTLLGGAWGPKFCPFLEFFLLQGQAPTLPKGPVEGDSGRQRVTLLS